MNIDELLAALKTNAEKTHKPIAVEVPDVGTVYVRRRTIDEFEELASVKDEVNGARKFGVALERLLADENGDRLPVQYREQLARLLGAQPETVFHQLLNAADGKTDIEKAAEAGN